MFFITNFINLLHFLKEVIEKSYFLHKLLKEYYNVKFKNIF